MEKLLGIIRTTEYSPDNRRIAVVKLTTAFLLELCKSKGVRRFEVTANALPDDVRAVGATYDVQYDAWDLTVTSESFGEVQDGVMPPVLDPPMWHEYPPATGNRN